MALAGQTRTTIAASARMTTASQNPSVLRGFRLLKHGTFRGLGGLCGLPVSQIVVELGQGKEVTGRRADPVSKVSPASFCVCWAIENFFHFFFFQLSDFGRSEVLVSRRPQQ